MDPTERFLTRARLCAMLLSQDQTIYEHSIHENPDKHPDHIDGFDALKELAADFSPPGMTDSAVTGIVWEALELEIKRRDELGWDAWATRAMADLEKGREAYEREDHARNVN